jgi:hypothetical protein
MIWQGLLKYGFRQEAELIKQGVLELAENLTFSREKRLTMIIISFQKVLESVSFCFVGYNVEYIIQPFELTYPIVRRLKFYYFHQSRLFLSVF